MDHLEELAMECGAESWTRSPMRAITGVAFTESALQTFAEKIASGAYALVKESNKRLAKIEAKKESQLDAAAELKGATKPVENYIGETADLISWQRHSSWLYSIDRKNVNAKLSSDTADLIERQTMEIRRLKLLLSKSIKEQRNEAKK